MNRLDRLDALALAWGLSLPLAFAPLGWMFFSLLGPAGLLFTIRQASRSRAFFRGWLFGIGCFGLGVSWVVESFQFSRIALPLALVLTVLFVAFLALFPALVAYLFRLAAPAGEKARWLLVAPALWILVEFARGYVFTGFTWLQLGYAQTDGPLAGFIPLLGSYGAGTLVAIGAGALAGWLARELPGWFAAVLILALTGAGWALNGQRWTEISGKRTVAMVQGNFTQDVKWRPSNRQPTLDRYRQLTESVLDRDLVVWPETALPGFLHRFKGYLDDLDARARETDTAILLGVPAQDPVTRQYFNAVVGIGRASGRYDKHHLVPFGEYLPFEAVLGPLVRALRIPMSNFKTAETPSVLAAAGTRVGISICYEATFAREVRRALPMAELLVNVSNDAWFGDSLAPHQHLQMVRMRALETGRAVVRATNTGISALIDARGRITVRGRQFVAEVVTGEVTLHRGMTPYMRFGDTPVLIALALMLLVGITLNRRV